MGARLTRDVDNPNRFVTFGPWASFDDIKRWRETKEFKDFFRAAKELSDSFEPITLEVVASIKAKKVEPGIRK